MSNPNSPAFRRATVNDANETTSTENRILILKPDTAQYRARTGLLNLGLCEMVGDKDGDHIFTAGLRIETALYYANIRDTPNFPISSRELAARAHVCKRTIERDLEYLRETPERTGGLRLQVWKPGGINWETEETFPNVFEWPSPMGLILETLDARVNKMVAEGKRGVGRCQRAEERILKELIAEVISSEKMQQLLRDERKKRLEREAAKNLESPAQKRERITISNMRKRPEDLDKDRYVQSRCTVILGELDGLRLSGVDVPREVRAWFAKMAGEE